MTAALDLAILQELAESNLALAQKVAALELVAAAAARPLSMRPASIRRRECARRNAAARRSTEIGSCDRALSTKPESIRRRKSEQKAAAERRGGSIAAIDPLYLQIRAYEKHADIVPKAKTAGPLAGDVSAIVDRAETRKKLELARLYGVIREGLFTGSNGRIKLGRWWARAASEWEDARQLLANYGIPQIRAAAVSLAETWKPSEQFSRPTVSLILWRLEVWRAGSRPAKRTDSRRMTGEQIENRHRESAAAPATKGACQPGEVHSPSRGPAERSHGNAYRARPGTPERASDVSELGRNPGEALSPVNAPEQAPRGNNTALSSAGPLQLAEPSASSSAAALAVLELVNETAARCRAFKRRGGGP